jgi:hypothetical protein
MAAGVAATVVAVVGVAVVEVVEVVAVVVVEEVGLFQDQAWVSLVGEELGCELGAAESSTLEALHMAVRRMDNSCQHYSHYHYSR